MQEYKGRREGIYLIRGVIMQVYKRNTIRMIEAYYGNTTGINGMDIRGILEQSPNIPKRESFFLSVLASKAVCLERDFSWLVTGAGPR